MKKIRINNLVSYSIGQVLLSIGVVLAVKSNYGVTVATAVAYVLSEDSMLISFGTYSYIIQGLIFVLMLFVLREKNPRYLISFITAIISGYLIDLSGFMMSGLMLEAHITRCLAFIASVVIISAGLVFFIKSEIPILPFDLFVKKMTDKYTISFSKFKMTFDIINLLLAVGLCFLFFGQLVGIHLGTVVSALTIGPCIGIIMGLFDNYFEVTTLQNRLRLSQSK